MGRHWGAWQLLKGKWDTCVLAYVYQYIDFIYIFKVYLKKRSQ
jgi:hypothetical protein